MYRQNNSRGYFRKPAVNVFIEAETSDEADRIFLTIDGCYFDPHCDFDCPCCGDRWYRQDTAVKFPLKYSDTLTFNTIEEYAQYVADKYGWTDPDCRLFYANGVVTDVQRAKKPQQMR